MRHQHTVDIDVKMRHQHTVIDVKTNVFALREHLQKPEATKT